MANNNGSLPDVCQIRTLGMLRSRFAAVPSAFCERLVPLLDKEKKRNHLVISFFITLQRFQSAP